MGISFANPLLAWGALAAAIPIAIHLLQRRRPRPHPFAAIELVRRSQQRNVRRLRLRRLLLLMARTSILLAIPLALARPQFTAAGDVAAASARGPAATAIVLDASLSMTWADGGKSLFERAKEDSRGVLAGLQAEDSVTVLICDGSSPQAAAPSFDRAAARRRIDEAQPSFLASDLTSCVAAAAQALGESPLAAKRIHVATDLTAAAWRLDGPPPTVATEEGDVHPEVVILDAARGKELPNYAITELSIAPAPEVGPRSQSFTVTVRNFGDAPMSDLAAELVVGDEIVAKSFLDLPAQGTASKRLSYRFAKGGAYTGVIRLAPDGLRADDERAFAIQIPPDLRALVVNGAPSPIRYRDEAFFVEAALRAGGAAPIAVSTVDAESLPAQDLSAFDLVLLLNVQAPAPDVAARLADFVEDGGGLFLSLGDRVDPDDYNAVLEKVLPRPLHLLKAAAEPGREDQRPARFMELEYEHPIFQIFSGGSDGGLLSARTWRYFLLHPGTGGKSAVLASYDDGAPALVEGSRGRGRILLYTSTVDRDWSDWSIQTSFLPTIQQAAAYLSRTLEERHQRELVVGSSLALDAPEGIQLAAARGPDRRELDIGDGGIGPIERPGLYRVFDTAGDEREELSFAAVLDQRESDTRRLEPRELEAWFGGDRLQIERTPLQQRQRETPLWSLLAVVAILAFVSEGVLIRRP